jgi:hypothetical protein
VEPDGSPPPLPLFHDLRVCRRYLSATLTAPTD